MECVQSSTLGFCLLYTGLADLMAALKALVEEKLAASLVLIVAGLCVLSSSLGYFSSLLGLKEIV